jgi:PilZ domain
MTGGLEVLMLTTKQRADFRQPLQLPVRFRVLHDANPKAIPSETANLSPSGMFMHTRVRLKVGTPLSVSIRIPLFVSGSNGFQFRCMGRVVHEQQFPDGDRGYGVHFESVAAARQAARKALTKGFVASDGCSAPFVERRNSRRHDLQVCVHFRSFKAGTPNAELAAETLNFSWRGLFLATHQVLEVGSPLSLSLETGESGANGDYRSQASAGRVVRGQPMKDGRIGYGIQIENQLLRLAAVGED